MGAGGGGPLEFRVLGTFEAMADDRPIPIGSPKQRALLAMLVLDLNRVVSLDSIVDELWGARPLANPNASVQSLVSRLRHSLSGAGCAGEVRLLGREPGYLLEADRLQVDAHQGGLRRADRRQCHPRRPAAGLPGAAREGLGRRRPDRA